jgi:hypothetical protein
LVCKDNGNCFIVKDGAVIAELRMHRKTQQERALALGLGKIRDDALILATWDGKPRTPNALSKD